MKTKHKIFISGGTGYIGTHLLPELLKRGHEVTVVVRKGSEQKVTSGAKIVTGNSLDPNTFKDNLKNFDTFVQLVGTPHPAPWKAEQFKAVDLEAVKASFQAIKNSKIKHYVYMSVAHPAPIMKSYWKVRAKAEQLIKKSGLNATILRPWYVLGPGHYWPILLLPFYKIFEILPFTRKIALQLALVKLDQIIEAFVKAIENPPRGFMIIKIEKILNQKKIMMWYLIELFILALKLDKVFKPLRINFIKSKI